MLREGEMKRSSIISQLHSSAAGSRRERAIANFSHHMWARLGIELQKRLNALYDLAGSDNPRIVMHVSRERVKQRAAGDIHQKRSGTA